MQPHAAVHHPADRRFRIWIRPSILIAAAVLVLLPVLAAWVGVLQFGTPYMLPVPQVYPNNFSGPHGFPLWVRYCQGARLTERRGMMGQGSRSICMSPFGNNKVFIPALYIH